MAIRIVRLGTERVEDEGVRIGTVRRRTRGVSKAKFASDHWYDGWYPNLSPSAETMQPGLHAATLAGGIVQACASQAAPGSAD